MRRYQSLIAGVCCSQLPARNRLDEDRSSQGFTIPVAFEPAERTLWIIFFCFFVAVSLVSVHMITGAIATLEVDHCLVSDEACHKHLGHIAKSVGIILADDTPTRTPVTGAMGLAEDIGWRHITSLLVLLRDNSEEAVHNITCLVVVVVLLLSGRYTFCDIPSGILRIYIAWILYDC